VVATVLLVTATCAGSDCALPLRQVTRTVTTFNTSSISQVTGHLADPTDRDQGVRILNSGFGPLFDAVSIFRQAAIRRRIRSLSAVGSPRCR
jgi:hypothetical protein